MSGDMLGQALAFHAVDCCVIPAAVDGTKAPWPDGARWQRYQSERSTETQLCQWFRDGQYDGFGLVCGRVSGELEMFEFEGRAVGEGTLAAFNVAITDHGLDELWKRITGGYMEMTPSGGLHTLYRVDGRAQGCRKLARRPATAAELAANPGDKLRVLIEVKGEGGFTITAPSGGRTHPTGKPWQLASGGPATIAVITEDERDALHAIASLLTQEPPRFQRPAAGQASRGQDQGRPGDDFAERVSWPEILEPHDWRVVCSFGQHGHGWCRPGKDRGISATTRDDGGFYVFSTSTSFEDLVPYSKFGVYAELNHGGDYTAAAAQLRREGYGARQEPEPARSAPAADSGKDQPAPPSTAVPACDPGMFRGVLGDIVTAADAGTEADKVGVYVSLLSAVSALIGRDPCVLIANTRHPLLIWSLLIGRTNIGRKGEATTTAMRVVRRADNDVFDITESGLSSGEGLIERIRDIEDEEDKGGTNDKRLLVIETEMAMVMAACAREGTKLPGMLRQAWDGDRLASLIRKRIVASYSHVAIIGHITPREFRAKLRDSDLAGGTWNRYLPIYVERRRRIPLPAGLDEDTQLPGLAKKLGEAIEFATKRRAIDLTEDAARLWTGELYQEFTEFDEDTPAADFVQRAAPYCRRLAALHAALDGRGSVTAADLQAAAHLIRYSIASARYVLDPAPRDVRLDKLRRAVDEAGMAGLSRAEARNVFGGHLAKDDMDNLITQLCADGSYAQEEIPTDGRPRTVIRAARKARKAR